MVVRDSLATSFLISFPSGRPDGNVTWQLRDETATVIATGSIVVPSDAVSVNLPIQSQYNTLTTGTLYGYRDITWTYQLAGAVVNDERRYTIEGRVPFGASTAGVRTKLGIDDVNDLPDSEISLVRAYSAFQTTVGADALALATNYLAVADAIEAQAAITLIPSMAVRVAVKESSGTNSYQRQDVDWAALGASLDAIVQAGIVSVLPTYDPTLAFTGLFILASPATDAITGA